MRIRGILAIPPLAVGAVALPPGPPSPPLDEAEAMLIQPFLGRIPLADAISAHPTPGGALVPLGEVCRLLAFGILVDADRGTAAGFFITEKRRFSLDLARGTVESDGRKSALLPQQAIRQGQDIYVEARLLQDWFPLEAAVDLRAAVLLLKPKEKLPIQEIWERERAYGPGGPGGFSPDPDAHLPGAFLPTPYRAFTLPFVDLSASWSRNRATGSTAPQASAFLGGDLLWMSMNAYGTRDPDGRIRNARGTLFREDPHGGLLGPLQARRLSLGDLPQAPALNISGALPRGRGALLDNYPIGYRSKFATRSFQGPLPDGWSVELFHNRSLVAFQRSRPDGRYQFQDLPLRFGLNQFRLVFHGPMGERREETYRMDIAGEQPPPGAFYYRVAALRPDLDASTLDPDQVPDPRALQRTASFAEVEYGLASFLSANAGYTRIALPTGMHDYTEAGLRGMFSFLSVQANAAQDRSPGRTAGLAAEGVVRTGWDYSTLTLRRSEYRRGFQRADFLVSGGGLQNLRTETAAELYGSLTLGGLPFSATLSRVADEFTTGHWTARERMQVSATFGRINLSQSLQRTLDSRRRGTAPLDGTLILSAFSNAVVAQGELTFRREAGHTEVTGWGASGDYRSSGGTLVRLLVKGTSGSMKDATVVGTLSRMTGHLGYGVDVHYARASGATLGLRLQVSFGREPRTGRWVAAAQPMAALGAVSARAFMDRNANGTLDPGETVIPASRFKSAEAPVESRIQDGTVTFQTHLPAGQEIPIRLDPTSLDDPALQSTVKAYRIVPRSGRVALLDFPVATFGEITGTTRIRRPEGTADYGGLELELLKATGEPARRIRSAYDGFFEIRDLPIGEYLLRIPPGELRRLRLKDIAPRRILIDAERNLFEGQDFTVEPEVKP
ncbi:MAG TPA: hypothetical protein VFV26_08755 [Geothrix sp.]|nr:hypothetical protein [Geothrix sp.]